VASFSGGAVGVISALMVVEINNVKQQEQKRCKYCLGTGKISKPLLISAMHMILLSSCKGRGGEPKSLTIEIRKEHINHKTK